MCDDVVPLETMVNDTESQANAVHQVGGHELAMQ